MINSHKVFFVFTILVSSLTTAKINKPFIVIAGQSNAGYIGKNSDLDRQQRDALLYGRDQRIWHLKTNFPGNQQWSNYVLQRDNPNTSKIEGMFGVELGIAYQVVNHFKGVSLLKNEIPGSSMGDDWHPELTSGRQLYKQLITNLKDRQDEHLKKYGCRPQVDGVVWMQGESDISFWKALRYEGSLKKLIAAMRRDLKQPELKVFIGETYTKNAHKKTGHRILVNAQKKVAEEDDNVFFVPTRGLPQTDGVHFTSDSIFEIGERFGDTMIDEIVLTPDLR